VVVVIVGAQVQDARRVAQPPQQQGAQQAAVQAVAFALAQHAQWTAVELIATIGDIVQKCLDLGGGIERLKRLALTGSQQGKEVF
jgi:phosphoribosylformimino-5-aminoimidazole carboxamide ribonucleotide (ProFAR) isomerase